MLANRITLHCSDTPNGKWIDPLEVKRWHVDGNGWDDIGYHYLINVDGNVSSFATGVGRALNKQGAHVAGENKNNIGICLIGRSAFTKDQWKALREQIDGLRLLYQIPAWNIWCHYEFPSAKAQGKQCPNVRAVDFLLWYLHEIDDPIKQNIHKNGIYMENEVKEIK